MLSLQTWLRSAPHQLNRYFGRLSVVYLVFLV